MASSERKKLSLSLENISNLSATDTNELIINEDSDNDNYDSEDFEEAYNDLFSDGTESDIEFEGFSSEDDEESTDDDLTSSDDEGIIVNQQPRNWKMQATDSPDGWGMKLRKKGDTKNCNPSPNLLLYQDLILSYQMMLMSYIFWNFSSQMNYFNQLLLKPLSMLLNTWLAKRTF